MKKNSGKLLLAAAALGFAAVSTVGSTYAWFTVNGTASVSGVSMSVKTGNDILIRDHALASTTTFGNSVAAGITATELSALTSVDGKTFYAIDETKHVNDAKTQYVYKTDSTTTGLVTFTLDVMVTTGADIQISNVQVSGTGASGAAINVARVAAYYGSEDATIYRLTKTENDNRATDYAFDTFKSIYTNNAESFVSGQTCKAGNLATQLTDGVTKWAPGACASLEGAKLSTYGLSGDANTGFATTTVTFNLWFEGNDYDCTNKIFGQALAVSFDLKAVAHA